jgi:hypothetical protein
MFVLSMVWSLGRTRMMRMMSRCMYDGLACARLNICALVV